MAEAVGGPAGHPHPLTPPPPPPCCSTDARPWPSALVLIVLGLVIAAATGESYQPLAEANILSGRCWTAPVLAQGRLYARNAAGDVVCLNLAAHP